jgi:hypothetical protein
MPNWQEFNSGIAGTAGFAMAQIEMRKETLRIESGTNYPTL